MQARNLFYNISPTWFNCLFRILSWCRKSPKLPKCQIKFTSMCKHVTTQNEGIQHQSKACYYFGTIQATINSLKFFLKDFIITIIILKPHDMTIIVCLWL